VPVFLLLQRLLVTEAGGLSGDRSVGGAPRSALAKQVVKRFPNWAPPTQKEAKAYAKAFALPGELLAVYACTVPLKLTYQGYLYLSLGHICFQAVTFAARGLSFAVAVADVNVKESVLTRDVATLVLKQPLQLKGGKISLASVEFHSCEAGSAAIAALIQGEEGQEGQESGEEENEEEEEAPTSNEPSASSRALAVFSDGEPFRSLMEVNIPLLPVGPIAADLLAGEWKPGCLLNEHFTRLGATGMMVKPWIEDAGGGDSSSDAVTKVREAEMQVPVPPAPMCPRTTRMTVTICVRVQPSEGPPGSPAIVLHLSSISHDVPFGDKFVVQEKVEILPAESIKGATFRKYGRCVFLKSCGMMQSVIRSNSATQTSRSGEMMVSLLHARAPQASPDASPRRRTTCTVHIWELQRRVTLFSSNWLPPFLPHDGRKRWRWVDSAYQVHAWTSAESLEDSAACTVPPIRPSMSWAAAGTWAVRPISDGCDGWQYAIDFYRSDKYWGTTAAGRSVRRRLWMCTFTEAERVGYGAA